MRDETKQEIINCIEMKIAQASAEHWQHPVAPTLDEAIEGIGGSEIAAVRGIIKTLGLDDSAFETLVGTLNEDGKPNKDGEIFTKETISENISSQVKTKLEGSKQNKKILSIISTIHDAWVNNNPNNFLMPDRNRERQFVPVELLDWKEVENDFVFLKPILQAAGIEIDEKSLQEEFELMQKEYMIDNKIFSHENLVKHLMNGSKFYGALEGLETEHGGSIDALLHSAKVAENMARQMEERGVIAKSKKELSQDIVRKALLSSNEEEFGLMVRICGNGCNGGSKEKGEEVDDEYIDHWPELAPKAMTKTQYENRIRISTNTY